MGPSPATLLLSAIVLDLYRGPDWAPPAVTWASTQLWLYQQVLSGTGSGTNPGPDVPEWAYLRARALARMCGHRKTTPTPSPQRTSMRVTPTTVNYATGSWARPSVPKRMRHVPIAQGIWPGARPAGLRTDSHRVMEQETKTTVSALSGSGSRACGPLDPPRHVRLSNPSSVPRLRAMVGNSLGPPIHSAAFFFGGAPALRPFRPLSDSTSHGAPAFTAPWHLRWRWVLPYASGVRRPG